MSDVFPVSKLSLVMGYNQDLRAVELPFTASPNRQIYVSPGALAVIINTHPVSGDRTVQEFKLDKYFSWSYSPIKPDLGEIKLPEENVQEG